MQREMDVGAVRRRGMAREDAVVNAQEPAVISERVGPDGMLAIISLNRPDALGALSQELKELLLKELSAAAADANVRAVLLTGRGRGFSVGQDLRELSAEYEGGGSPDLAVVIRSLYNPIVQTITEMPKPVVAAINGAIAGAAFGIALACDLRWAARSAVFATAFTGIGLAGDSGITWQLNRLVGPAKAAALMYLNDRLSSEQALELGLVNAVVDDELLAGSARELALRLAAGPTAAYAAIKRTLAHAATQPLADSLELEADLQRQVGYTADHRNAVAAFLAKQQPTFQGR
jgi:2-(1,2-epoxy-1,2-dihydrophenyl)acetyl-CoA isomerase